MAQTLISDFRSHPNPILANQDPSRWIATSEIESIPLWKTNFQVARTRGNNLQNTPFLDRNNNQKADIVSLNTYLGRVNEDGNYVATLAIGSNYQAILRQFYNREEVVEIDRSTIATDTDELETEIEINLRFSNKLSGDSKFFIRFGVETAAGFDGWYESEISNDVGRDGFTNKFFYLPTDGSDVRYESFGAVTYDLRVQFLVETPFPNTVSQHFDVDSLIITKFTQTERNIRIVNDIRDNGGDGINGVTTPPKGPGG